MKSSALKKLSAAVASALVLSSAVHAAGLGKLTVLSALGQPLRAEIELTAVSSDEANGLVAKLASPEAFRTANIEFNPALLSLRFAVEQRNGRQFIRVSSTQPLNEPFVDMLLELSWNNGRLVREYTFLLDPAELRATQPAQVAASEAAARPRAEAAAPAAAAPVAAERPRRGRARAEEGGEAPAGRAADAGASKYRVKQGDSLGKIAAQLKPVDVSLDMMLVALYRANPDAFIGNNMNRLKSGRILSVPDAGSVQSLNDNEAHGVVVAHAADFNAYRNKLAGQVGAAEPVKTPQASQSAGGKITSKVEERPTAANESPDQLRLSKAPVTGTAGKGATTSTEDTIAKQRELEEAQQRVKELERNVSDLEKIATVKSKGGAEAQQNASAPAVAANPAATTPAQDKPAQKKIATIKPAAKPAAAPEPGLFDFIMDNLTLIVAGVAALGLGGLLVSQRRKKKDVKAVAEPSSILGVPTEPSHSLFAETGGQSIDTSNNSVFNSSFAPSASQLDTNEVDPVAEADVYIAYGRDAQAEEILKEALRTHPERYPVRLKLLEIYAARKDQRAFETQAGELYSMTRGQGEEWAQAAALGLSIDPLNPLYASGGAPADTAAPAAAEAHDFGAHDATAVPLAAGAAATAAAAVAAHEAMSFDQHFAGAMGAAQQAAEPAPAAPAAADDEHTLDFDLGGLAFEPVQAEEPKPAQTEQDEHVLDFDMSGFDAAPAASAAAPAAAPVEEAGAPATAEEALDFSFDMDFAAPAANPVPQPAPQAVKAVDDLTFGDFDLGGTVEAETPAAVSHSEFANSDFDMANLAKEFDLEPIPAAPEESSPATELKDPLFDLDTMDFGLADEAKPAPAESAAPAADPAPSFSLEDELFGNELPTATPAPLDTAAYAPHDMLEPQKVEADFDLGSFDLDLPGESAQALPELETVAAPAASATSAAHMEMETKLDLAIAYQEIGDKEGARELLEEVIKGGNSEQVTKANAMRAQLA
jgi:pilus assembly protein FimV